MLYRFLSFGDACAHLQDLQRRVKLHNDVPFITCEGKCSSHRETFTTHRLLSEIYCKDEKHYTQMYYCTICKTERQFGLTDERVTAKGESN